VTDGAVSALADLTVLVIILVAVFWVIRRVRAGAKKKAGKKAA
jgi:hypothetical protein